jgi:hypothetical protein
MLRNFLAFVFYSTFAAFYVLGLGHFFIYCKTVKEYTTFELVIHKLKFLTQWNSVSEDFMKIEYSSSVIFIFKDFANFLFSVGHFKFNL